MKPCERCGFEANNNGPFRDDTGKRWALLCVRCKIQLTLTPERKARLEAEARLALAALERKA